MCNDNIHDYTGRGVVGRWIMFGYILVLEDDKKMDEFIEKLRGSRFVVKKLKGTEIWVYLNDKLAGIFEKIGYDFNMGMLKRSTIFDMVKENK